MKKAALLLLVSALIGCKGTNEKLETTEGIGSITTPKERNYTTSELVIGRRICESLKHKRELFETLTNMQEQFRFRGELKNCDNPVVFGQQEFTATISTVSSTDFEYVASRSSYFKDVVTDQNGAMKLLCDSLSKSNTVSNTMLSGSSYLVINLLISNGYDRYEVSKRSKDSSGNYSLVSTEAVSVITMKTQADEKFFGVEKERVRYSTCSGSKDFSTIKQTWLTALTSF